MAVHPRDKNKPTLDKILQESFDDMGKGERNIEQKASEELSNSADVKNQDKPQDYEYNKVYRSSEISTMASTLCTEQATIPGESV